MSHSKILIVDDEPDIRLLLTLAFASLPGSSIVEAPDGLQAIEVARRERPDIVILDANMPGMSGPESVPALREAAPGCFIALFSAITDDRLVEFGDELGIEVFPKTRIPDLIERISLLLQP